MKVRVPKPGYSGPRHRGQEALPLVIVSELLFVLFLRKKKLVSIPHPDTGMLGLNVGTTASSFMGIRTQVLRSECQVLYHGAMSPALAQILMVSLWCVPLVC